MLENVKYVLIGGRKFEIEGSVNSLEEIKQAAVEYDPSLSNADVVVSGDTVSFVKRAGTKGAEQISKVVYQGRTFEVDTDMYDNPQDIKDAMAEIYPELSNADYVISGDTMTFVMRAGTKGR